MENKEFFDNFSDNLEIKIKNVIFKEILIGKVTPELSRELYSKNWNVEPPVIRYGKNNEIL